MTFDQPTGVGHQTQRGTQADAAHFSTDDLVQQVMTNPDVADTAGTSHGLEVALAALDKSGLPRLDLSQVKLAQGFQPPPATLERIVGALAALVTSSQPESALQVHGARVTGRNRGTGEMILTNSKAHKGGRGRFSITVTPNEGGGFVVNSIGPHKGIGRNKA